MSDTQLYEELARHLDEAIVGVPPSPTLIEILEILFPGEEAEVGARLPFADQTLDQLKELLPDKAESLAEVLDRMAWHGTVFAKQPPGQESTYRLLPSIVGFTETPFWAGKDTPDARALAPLWIRYYEETFGGELARGVPLIRVVPIGESLKDESEVLPYDEIKKLFEDAPFIAVAHCPCRQIQRYEGAGCEHSLENCFHLGSMGRYIVEHAMGREIDKNEAIKILDEANEEGLVHVVDNMQGLVSTVCSCCSCCCVFLRTKVIEGLDVLSRSNYVALVDRETCVGCATCEDRCPVGAIAVGDDEIASVDSLVCIGCGVCTPTCDSGAVALEVREEVKPPPELVEFVTARLKTK